MSNWTSFLVKTALSASLVEACRAAAGRKAKASCLEQLGAPVESAADLKTLRAAVKALTPLLPATLAEDIDEEVREIAGDARWSKTGRGKYIISINQWIQPFFAEFRARSQYGDVVIGGHASRQVVFISGFVSSPEVFRELMAYVHSKKPPYKVMTDVRLGDWKGPPAIP